VKEEASCVLDASALLAFFQEEIGAESVEAVLEHAVVSTVNWSEVHRRAAARGVDVRGLWADVEALGVRLVPFTRMDAERAAALRPSTRERGLSLADRACLALAARLGLPALTADRAWQGLELDVDVRSIR